MDLRDSDAEAQFRQSLRGWLRERLPEPGQLDQSWPVDELRVWSKGLHEAGYAGLTWPVAYGGRGKPPTYQAIFAEESALAGAPDHLNVIGMNMVGPTLIAHGTAEQQQRFLPGILSGDILFCQGFSEPEAGSDLASVRTRATLDGDSYLVEGEKVWSSYAHLADFCLLLARTDSSGPKHQGLTCFLLDMRAPGVQVRPLRQLSGESDFNQIVLDRARIPRSQVVGEVGQGWPVALSTLAHERGTFGITLTARLTVQFQRLLATVHSVGASQDPLVRREVAELYVRLAGLRHTGYRALSALAATGQPGPESSILKLEWSLTHQRLCSFALRLLGQQSMLDAGDAPLRGHWQRSALRSRANSIEGGTSEILRGIVAERVLGLPRSRQ